MMQARAARKAAGVLPSFKRVDTCAAEFEAETPYMYSCYDGECECDSTSNKKVRAACAWRRCCALTPPHHLAAPS
jgi:carbamoyl-phosphate synthase large subunit